MVASAISKNLKHVVGQTLSECRANASHPSSYPPPPSPVLSRTATAVVSRPGSATLDNMELWNGRFYEEQEPGRAFCGRHALNNLLGGPQFDDEALRIACATVCGITGDHEREHLARDGWYSHSVLAQAFDLLHPPPWRSLTDRVAPGTYDRYLHNEQFVGILLNHGNTHWTTITRWNSNLWHVDSLPGRGIQLLRDSNAFDLVLLHCHAAYPVVLNGYQES